MQDIDIESCHGVDSLRHTLENVEIHRTISRMKVLSYYLILVLPETSPFIILLSVLGLLLSLYQCVKRRISCYRCSAL